MTKFLILYRSTVSAADQMDGTDPEAGEATMKAWMDWATRAADAIVDLGMPTQTVSGGEPGSYIGGYSIMQADSLAELETSFTGHPHLAYGGTIEVLELLPLPGM